MKKITTQFRILLLATTMTCTLLIASQPASAEITPITSGEVEWNFKQSFRDYILGPIANGSITADEGAVFDNNSTAWPTIADDTITLPVTSGGFDTETQNLDLQLAGTLNFTGHSGSLNTTFSDLRIELRDGASVIKADMLSNPLGGGGAVDHQDVVVGRLNLSGVTPVVASGQTTWTAIPGVLTGQGAEIVGGGRYNAGDPLDPVSIAYTGPGGVPLPEPFDAPGTPKYASVADATFAATPISTWHDVASGVVHLLTDDSLTALDAETLAIVDSVDAAPGETFWVDGNTFAGEHATVFASYTPGGSEADLQAFEFDDTTGEYTQIDTGLPAARTTVYSSATNRVYAIASAESGTVAPTVAAADYDSGAWTPRPAYSNIATGGDTVRTMITSSTGKIVGTYAPVFTGSMPTINVTRKPIYSFVDDGSALVPTLIPLTQHSPVTTLMPAAAGYSQFVARPDGALAAIEQFPSAASRQLINLEPSVHASGFEVATQTHALDFQPTAQSYDSASDLYMGNDDTIDVSRVGDSVATIDTGDEVRLLEGGNDRVYAVVGAAAPYALHVFEVVGLSPSIATQPTGESVEIGASSESASVTFTSLGTGDPAPTVRWQVRAFGQSSWTDISGATNPILTFDAQLADDDKSYRAIYTNLAGEIATTSVSLDVAVNDVEAPVVSIQSPTNGATTTAASITLAFTVTDNDDANPLCTLANNSSQPLKLGANSIVVTCVDNFGNVGTAQAAVTRAEPALPAPAEIKLATSRKVTKLKSKGRSVKLKVGTLTCASQTTCVYTLPNAVKTRFGKKSFRLKVSGPATLEPGKSGAITVTVPAAAIRALKGKRTRVVVSVTVANAAGARHETAKNAIANLRG